MQRALFEVSSINSYLKYFNSCIAWGCSDTNGSELKFLFVRSQPGPSPPSSALAFAPANTYGAAACRGSSDSSPCVCVSEAHVKRKFQCERESGGKAKLVPLLGFCLEIHISTQKNRLCQTRSSLSIEKYRSLRPK
jgi:hypothetical protein